MLRIPSERDIYTLGERKIFHYEEEVWVLSINKGPPASSPAPVRRSINRTEVDFFPVCLCLEICRPSCPARPLARPPGVTVRCETRVRAGGRSGGAPRGASTFQCQERRKEGGRKKRNGEGTGSPLKTGAKEGSRESALRKRRKKNHVPRRRRFYMLSLIGICQWAAAAATLLENAFYPRVQDALK